MNRKLRIPFGFIDDGAGDGEADRVHDGMRYTMYDGLQLAITICNSLLIQLSVPMNVYSLSVSCDVRYILRRHTIPFLSFLPLFPLLSRRRCQDFDYSKRIVHITSAQVTKYLGDDCCDCRWYMQHEQ